MRKFKRWLIERFLPVWCREELLTENRRLRERGQQKALDEIQGENLQSRRDEAQREIDRLNAYVDGVRDAIRRQPRITINGGEQH